MKLNNLTCRCSQVVWPLTCNKEIRRSIRRIGSSAVLRLGLRAAVNRLPWHGWFDSIYRDGGYSPVAGRRIVTADTRVRFPVITLIEKG